MIKHKMQQDLNLPLAQSLANALNTQFGHVPLIRMFTSKSSMQKMNKIHWRALDGLQWLE